MIIAVKFINKTRCLDSLRKFVNVKLAKFTKDKLVPYTIHSVNILLQKYT